MLVGAGQPSSRRAIHVLPVAGPDLGPYRVLGGLRVIPLSDLIRMKLTCFRARDETQLKDLDEVGLITPEIEATLPPVLSERLAHVRARD